MSEQIGMCGARVVTRLDLVARSEADTSARCYIGPTPRQEGFPGFPENYQNIIKRLILMDFDDPRKIMKILSKYYQKVVRDNIFDNCLTILSIPRTIF